eukprot:5330306-Amphidinium_carterae.1
MESEMTESKDSKGDSIVSGKVPLKGPFKRKTKSETACSQNVKCSQNPSHERSYRGPSRSTSTRTADSERAQQNALRAVQDAMAEERRGCPLCGRSSNAS